MTVLMIGASGAIGSVILPALSQKYTIITAGRNSGDVRVDLSSAESIENMFRNIGNIDACICIAGDTYTGALSSLTEANQQIGIQQKLIAQVNLVRIGIPFINPNGSFTLISGKMGDQPAPNNTGKAIINGAINSFVKAAALEMPNGIRINVISPARITDIPAEALTNAWIKSLEGNDTGEIIRINYGIR